MEYDNLPSYDSDHGSWGERVAVDRYHGDKGQDGYSQSRQRFGGTLPENVHAPDCAIAMNGRHACSCKAARQ